MEEIIKLTKKDIEKMKFKEQIALLEEINDYFQNATEENDIENALEIYKKALDILTYERKKLTTIKEEKKQIDEKYEEIKNSVE